VFNAFDGIGSLPVAPKDSLTFFRTNKKVCEDWFLRLRTPLFNSAWQLARLQIPDAYNYVVYHGELVRATTPTLSF